MRGYVPLLAIVLLAPLALGQSVLPSGAVTLLADVSGQYLPPDGSPIEIPIVAEASCDASAAAGSIAIDYAIAEVPAWASASIDPAHDEADVMRCQDGSVRFETRVRVGASPQAPAFRPELVRISATVSQPLRATTVGETSFPVGAGYYSIIEAEAEEPLLVALEPGTTHNFQARFTNRGNGNTRIDFEVVVDGNGVKAEPPNPLLLGSRQSGSISISDDATLWVERTAHDTHPATIELRWRASYALDRFIVGDTGTITFAVASTEGDSEASRPAGSAIDELEARVPMPSAALAFGVVALAALVHRRR